MLFFSDSSDEQALGFSACYNKVCPYTMFRYIPVQPLAQSPAIAV